MPPDHDYALVLIRAAAAAICSILCKLALALWLLANGQGSPRLGKVWLYALFYCCKGLFNYLYLFKAEQYKAILCLVNFVMAELCGVSHPPTG